MSSKLILSKQELNEDVYFKDPSKWNIGVDWTVYLNSQPGAICTAATGSFLEVANSKLKYSTEYKYTLRVESSTNAFGFLIIGGNTINIPVSGTYQIISGTVTSASNDNSVYLTANFGNDLSISYLKISESPGDIEIDITNDIDIPLNFSIADIRDPSSRNASYSKNASLPATKVNNKFFTHVYEISGDGSFNPNKKIYAQIIEEGYLIFKGYCQLKNISRKRVGFNNYVPISYEIILVGGLGDFFYLLGDSLLSDLDFSEYDHYYTVTNQRDSWYTQIQKNGSNYVNTLNGANLTITSCANNSGRLELNFSGAHGLIAEDWILIPDGSITSGSEFYYGEHEVYEVTSSTSVIIRCPFDPLPGTTLTTTNTVKKHSKKGEGYVYPMLNYEEVAGNNWSVGNFYPAIYLVEYFNKIAKKVGFVFDGNFLQKTMTKKMIVPFNGGKVRLTQGQIDELLFRASSTSLISGSYLISPSFENSGSYVYPANYKGHEISGFGPAPGYTPFSNTPPTILDIPIDNDSSLPNFDNGGNFNTTTYRWTCPKTGSYDLAVAAIISNNYTLPGGVTRQDGSGTYPSGYRYNWAVSRNTSFSGGGQPLMQLQVYDYTLGAVVSGAISNLPGVIINNNTTILRSSASLTAGHQYGVRLEYIYELRTQFWTTFQTVPYANDITIDYQVNANATFYDAISNTSIQEGEFLYMNSAVPQKIKCKDFFMMVVRAFNLYIQPDMINEKKLYIDTRNDFYNSGDVDDWTNKLDTDTEIKISLMASLDAKEYNYKHAEDKSTLGKDHKDKYGNGYGDLSYIIDNDYVKGKSDIETLFSSSILSEVQQGAGTGRIISMTTGENLRLLYFNTSSTVNQIPGNTWNHLHVGGVISSRVYPYAGHLDKVEAPNYDLNWGVPRGVYFDYDSWTNRGLFNQNYRQMLLEITDKNSRVINCDLHLKAKDIFNLDFRNLFVIDGHFLRLNKVGDYLVGKNLLSDCEFIKVENKAPFVANSYSSIGQEEPDYNPVDRMINGNPNPEVEIIDNNSNISRVGFGIEINGQGNNINTHGSSNILVNGDRNESGAFCSNLLIQGNDNIIYPGLSNISLINTSGKTITESDTVYVNGEIYSNKKVENSIDITVNTQLDVTYNNKTLYIDRTGGDITLTWNSSTMQDCKVTIIAIDATGNRLFITDNDILVTYIGNAVPFDMGLTAYDRLTITSKGSQIFIYS